MPEYQSYGSKNKKRGGNNKPPASMRTASPRSKRVAQIEDYKSAVRPASEKLTPQPNLGLPTDSSKSARNHKPPEQNRYKGASKKPTKPVSPPVACASSVTARRKIRRNYILHFLAASIVVVVAVSVLSSTVLFNVRAVNVEGESMLYSAEEILAAGNIETGGNLVRFKSGQAQEDIMNALVGLDSVTVRKVFPSTISITVEDAVNVFSIQSGRQYLGISQNGRIIQSGTRRPDGLVITGFVPKSKTVGDYLECELDGKRALAFQLSGLIEKHDLGRVIRIDLNDIYDIRLFSGSVSEEQIEIKLGTPSQLDEKLVVASKVITDELAPNERGVLRVQTPRKASFNPDLSVRDDYA